MPRSGSASDVRTALGIRADPVLSHRLPLLVECPTGATPGDLISVDGPRGQQVEVAVPPQVAGGDAFLVELRVVRPTPTRSSHFKLSSKTSHVKLNAHNTEAEESLALV